MADSGSNDVSILFGLGGGAFSAPTVYPVGDDPVALAVGDLNGVENRDLAVVSAAANEITYLSNMGDGTFYDTCEVPTSENPSGIVLGDFNGDHSVDVVVAFRNPAGLTLAFGNTTQNMPGQRVAPVMAFANVGSKYYDDWLNYVKTLPGFKNANILNKDVINQLFTWDNSNHNLFGISKNSRVDEKTTKEIQAGVITVLQARYSYLAGQSWDWLPPWNRGVTKADFAAIQKAFGAKKEGAINIEYMYDYSYDVIKKMDKYTLAPMLWQRGGPDYTKSHQGNIGDCHFIAPLDALAAVNKSAIIGGPPPEGQTKGTGLIWTTGDFSRRTLTIWVQWPNDKAPVKVLPPTLPELAFYSYADDGLWVTLIEKAYVAKRLANPFYSLLSKTLPASFADGDMIQKSMKLLTSNKVGLALIAKAPLSNKDLYNTIDTAIKNNKMVAAGTFRVKDLLPQVFKSDDYPPPNGHAYTVLDVIPGPDKDTPWVGAEIKLLNPWNNPRKDYGTVFTYPIDKFRTNFFAIAWEK